MSPSSCPLHSADKPGYYCIPCSGGAAAALRKLEADLAAAGLPVDMETIQQWDHGDRLAAARWAITNRNPLSWPAEVPIAVKRNRRAGGGITSRVFLRHGQQVAP